MGHQYQVTPDGASFALEVALSRELGREERDNIPDKFAGIIIDDIIDSNGLSTMSIRYKYGTWGLETVDRLHKAGLLE